MENKEKRPAEMEAPTGTITITLPDYNMFSGEEQEKAVKAMELIWMALQVNGLNPRNNNWNPENNLPTMSCSFSGHVSEIEYRCFLNGYGDKCDLDNYDEYQVRHLKPNVEKERFFKNADSIWRWIHGILEGMKHDA